MSAAAKSRRSIDLGSSVQYHGCTTKLTEQEQRGAAAAADDALGVIEGELPGPSVPLCGRRRGVQACSAPRQLSRCIFTQQARQRHGCVPALHHLGTGALPSLGEATWSSPPRGVAATGALWSTLLHS